MSKLPTEEEFFKFFEETYPKGNPESSFNEVIYTICYKKLFANRGNITWDLIKDTYSKYIKKRTEEEFEGKFIKSIESFLKSGDYNINFDVEPDMKKRDMFEQGMNESYDDLERRLGGKNND
tara:strand:+ start:2320 stop:2685 length:366 start_codon:yes stop_codon:yes gene_type:complete